MIADETSQAVDPATPTDPAAPTAPVPADPPPVDPPAPIDASASAPADQPTAADPPALADEPAPADAPPKAKRVPKAVAALAKDFTDDPPAEAARGSFAATCRDRWSGQSIAAADGDYEARGWRFTIASGAFIQAVATGA